MRMLAILALAALMGGCSHPAAETNDPATAHAPGLSPVTRDKSPLPEHNGAKAGLATATSVVLTAIADPGAPGSTARLPPAATAPVLPPLPASAASAAASPSTAPAPTETQLTGAFNLGVEVGQAKGEDQIPVVSYLLSVTQHGQTILSMPLNSPRSMATVFASQPAACDGAPKSTQYELRGTTDPVNGRTSVDIMVTAHTDPQCKGPNTLLSFRGLLDTDPLVLRSQVQDGEGIEVHLTRVPAAR
jgi:hypothetical protein